MVTIDKQLRKAITDSGRTCYALAHEAGIRPELLSRFVKGERDLRLTSAAKVAAVLKMSLQGRKARKAPR